ncbi:bifunctional diaminohydroxyphosphoribosylaminopyrimidine deaminase/5-amino-6-(5-phosphoribosylamino)uracil reductase RibD [Helicobacter sp. MIT 03-1614]|uniref:bifunctional diaminohydroxyphosphoribosylaminopyrimidine deaminase/5-amino-6-(5-phosphoribosylamino)uracil reductase RibD n=1 Tax=Helicobacter sp. MIT 03-1614 TaxID=1548147 RepID=UPI000512CBF9|nr:bifunctional diaminohydroxyphosphoribosylaminopyrimidine deaminase/5-amino-6-(5-phosphoribosylamino)uracil reductase RibD [Helicobacter sp. MIT 03-1614]TLD90448.1 bifunctional diaminohydroxyphosphoribosylaminopyrimidine deaminase/5-amino-6-(5-phosphoribosylamino)uracil reductase RibD [Helicobacter sp. MIT 03-1614]
MSSSDELFLYYCCSLAWESQTLALPNPSVGALVVDKYGQILSQAVHKVAGSPHAEVLAIQAAYHTLSGDDEIVKLHKSKDIHTYLLAHHNGLFKECTLYVSLEPCNHYGKTPPCSQLLSSLGFSRVCIATNDTHALAAGGANYLSQVGINVCYIQSPTLQHLATHLLMPFEILRKNGRFALFKLALRLDGSYTQGRISSDISRQFTHNQRSVCDWICVSGNTLRNDNPQLNARYATLPYNNTHLPQVGIISRTLHRFDEIESSNIALSKNRVHFINDLSHFESLQGFVIVEGGWDLLHSLKEFIDMILIHQAFACDKGECLTHTLKTHFKLLHTMRLGEDMALWLH